MDVAQRRRWIVLLSILVGVLILSSEQDIEPLSAQEPEKVVRQSTQSESVDTGSSVALAMIPSRLEPRLIEGDYDDAFAVRSWTPPPPPPPKVTLAPKVQAPSTPPQPVVPSLPYRYLGRLEDGDLVTIFLGFGERNFAVKVGEVFEGNYRLESMQDNVLTFTYVPLNIRQTLSVERAN